MTKHKILSTKKLEPSLAALARQNLELTEENFISIQAIDTQEKHKEIGRWMQAHQTCAAFTSANAVTALTAFTHAAPNWKIFCLSGKTKQTLAQPEFRYLGTIIDTAVNATDLAKTIIANNIKELLFFCGDRRRDALPAILQASGVIVHEVIVYQTVETPVRNEEDTDGILFFSPSAVESFFSVNTPAPTTVCFATGSTTAESLASVTANRIITSPEPGQQAMLATVNKYFDKTYIE
jgi:uroporphyrinogen-III synthase